MTGTDGRARSGPSPSLSVELGDPAPGADLHRVREGVARGVASGQGLELDLSRVAVLSSPVVATILWAQRSCLTRNLPFAVTGGHPGTRRVLARCGLAQPGASR